MPRQQLLLECEPSTDVVFSGDFTTPTSVGVTVRNRTRFRAQFRVKTDAPRCYFAVPSQGEIPALSSVVIVLTKTPFNYEKSDHNKNDLFLLVAFKKSKKNSSLSESGQWSKFAKEDIFIRKIRCFFDFTPKSGNTWSSSRSKSVPEGTSRRSFEGLDQDCSMASVSWTKFGRERTKSVEVLAGSLVHFVTSTVHKRSKEELLVLTGLCLAGFVLLIEVTSYVYDRIS